jgi:hypothetical protein
MEFAFDTGPPASAGIIIALVILLTITGAGGITAFPVANSVCGPDGFCGGVFCRSDEGFGSGAFCSEAPTI